MAQVKKRKKRKTKKIKSTKRMIKKKIDYKGFAPLLIFIILILIAIIGYTLLGN